MNWFAMIAGHPTPALYVRGLRCHDLAAAESELREIREPNEFQAAVYGLLAAEAILRWKTGLLTHDAEEVTG